MQVVLLEDVKALGKKGQIVNVNDGYARNFILPKKLGVEANSKNLNDLKLKKANDDRIAKAIGDQLGIDIDKKKIMLSDPIKSIGSFEVPVKLHKDVTARLAVKVVEA